MATATTRHTGFRYIEADWGDDDRPPRWHLWVDGQHVAGAAVTDWTHPPFALTEGLPFRPQWHSAASEEPDSWVYRPPAPSRRTLAFWPLLAVAGLAGAVSPSWRPALIVTIVAVVTAAAVEVRRH